MRILVTGGCGFMGSAVVKELVARGHHVRVLDDFSRSGVTRGTMRVSGLEARVEIVHGDIRKENDVLEAMRGMESVFHFAFINGTRYFYERPLEVMDVGVRGMLNVIAGCKYYNIKELITASSSEVYQTPPWHPEEIAACRVVHAHMEIPTSEAVRMTIPDPLNPRYSYAAGKIMSEMLTLHSGIERVLVFRPHNVYGPDMGYEHVIPELIKKMLEAEKKEIPIQGRGDETRAFVYISDFVLGLMTMWEKGEHKGIYNIGTEDEISIMVLVAMIAERMNFPLRNLIRKELAKGGTPRRCPLMWKLKKLGYEPKVSLKEGLDKTVPWYVNEMTKKTGDGNA